jgi:hypothetical protein
VPKLALDYKAQLIARKWFLAALRQTSTHPADDHFIGIAVHGDQALVSSIWCIKIIDRHDLVPQGSSRGV